MPNEMLEKKGESKVEYMIIFKISHDEHMNDSKAVNVISIEKRYID